MAAGVGQRAVAGLERGQLIHTRMAAGQETPSLRHCADDGRRRVESATMGHQTRLISIKMAIQCAVWVS